MPLLAVRPSASTPTPVLPLAGATAVVPRPRALRVGLVGLGTVGQGLCALLDARAEDLARRHRLRPEVTHVLVRDATKPRAVVPRGADVTTDATAFLEADVDVVVEAAGGVEAVAPIVEAFLGRAVPVVTANKALLADRGPALFRRAEEGGAALRFEASVAAGIPLFGLLERSLQSTRVSRVEAVLNATSNVIATLVDRAGATVEDALGEARRRGFAEADAGLDVSGLDAAQKLCVLAFLLSGRSIAWTALEVEGVGDLRPADASRARRLGGRVKPVAVADLADGPPTGFVAPAFVPEAHPLARVDDGSNGVRLRGDVVDGLFLSGPGAGGVATAASILDDLVAVAEDPTRPPRARVPLETGAPPRREALETSWMLAVPLGARREADAEAEAVARLADAGLRPRRLDARDEPAGRVLLTLTAPAPRSRVAGLAARLRRVGLSLRALRALDA